VLTNLSHRLRQKVINLLRKTITGSNLTAWCYKHGRRCSVKPPRREGSLHLEAGGNTCVAFSMQGAKQLWLHESSAACLIWMVTTELQRPAMLLQECSATFNTQEVLGEVFQEDWQSQVYVFGQNTLGVPMTRPRKYSWTIDKRQLCMTQGCTTTDFCEVMGRSLVLNGHVFFAATQEMQQRYFKQQFGRQGVDMQDQEGKQTQWSPELFLPVGDRSRFAKYKPAVVDAEPMLSFEPIVDLSQDISVRRSFTDVVPSLLRKSDPFSFEFMRGMTVEEAFCAMGFPVPGMFRESCRFADSWPFADGMLDRLHPSKLWGLLGNAMQARAVGSLMVFARANATLQPKLAAAAPWALHGGDCRGDSICMPGEL